ncbi:MAG: ribosome-recycling factor, partial [Vibrio sp.]|nr:ribosome-recycling factor [Vibrio sp.]
MFWPEISLKATWGNFLSWPRQILIQPWDKSYNEGIVRALEKTGIGANPIVDKEVIRINLPP